jgi:hypothetical protein
VSLNQVIDAIRSGLEQGDTWSGAEIDPSAHD